MTPDTQLLEMVKARAKALFRQARTEHRQTEKDLHSCIVTCRKLALISIDVLELQESLNEAFEQNSDGSSLAEGINAVIVQTREILASVDIFMDGEVGESFDPTRHECIEEILDEQAPARAIIRVIRCGIVFKGRRLRSAQVVVNQRRGL